MSDAIENNTNYKEDAGTTFHKWQGYYNLRHPVLEIYVVQCSQFDKLLDIPGIRLFKDAVLHR